jgi:hypothetical protein
VPVDSVSSVSPIHESLHDERQSPQRETARAAMPPWAQVAGLVILLAFVGLSIEAYF